MVLITLGLLSALTTYWGIHGGAWIVIGTAFSGLVLAAATKFFNRNVEKRDDRKIDPQEIAELRERIDRLRQRLRSGENATTASAITLQGSRFILNNGDEPPARPKD